MGPDELLSLIDRLYETAINPELWPFFALTLARCFGCESGVVQVQNRERNIVSRLSTTSNYTPELNEAYRSYYYRHDLWVAGGMMTPTGRSLVSQDLVDDAVFYRSIHYNEFCKQVGIACVLGSVFPLGDGMIGVVGVHRPPGAPHFDVPDKRQMDLFLPHLRRALQVHLKLAAATSNERASLDALDRLPSGVVLLDASGRVVFVNRAAQRMAAAADGFSIVNAMLQASRNADDVVLRRLVGDALGDGLGAGGTLALPRPSGKRPFAIVATPLSSDENAFAPLRPAALVFITDPEAAPTPPRELLRRLFGLTARESELTAALATGERLDEVADRLGLARATARTHLSRILEKTDTHSQAQLVALVVRTAAPANEG